MSLALQPYPAYKASGAEWLGEVPEGWDVRRMKTLLRERVERGRPEEQLLAATQSEGVIPKDSYGQRTVTATGDLALLKLVERDDFVISLRSFQGGIEYSRARGIISPAYTILRSRQRDHHGYLALLFKSRRFIESLKLCVTGIRQGQNIDYERLARSLLPVPPAADREAISRYVGHVDARIRTLLAARERLVELLAEEEREILHRAVTRGLDPGVPSAPSGVDWIGEMPAHWRVKELRRLGRVLGGLTPSMDRLDYWGGGIPWVSPKDMKRAEIDSSIDSVTPAALAETGLRLIPAGAVLMVVRGMILARHVPIARTSTDVSINQDMKAIVPGGEIDGAFLARALGAAQLPLMRMTDEAAHGTRRLPTERWRHLRLPLPPLAEQRAIVAEVDRRKALREDAQQRAQRQIRLLHEYRARLISDVVTGKLDVRAAAAELPGEAATADPALEESLEAAA